MGTSYLLDTNAVIYYLDGVLPEKALDFVEENLDETGGFVSIISKIELLGWQAPSPNAIRKVENFVNDCEVLSLTDEIANKAI
jgi:predicted nucleic acid-binding protein